MIEVEPHICMDNIPVTSLISTYLPATNLGNDLSATKFECVVT